MIQALCWTLIHSLWIGAFFALLTAALLLLTRKTKAAIRYNALVGLFTLFVAIIGTTYYKVVQDQARNAVTVSAISSAALKQNKFGAQPIVVTFNMPETSWLGTATDWCNTNAWLIVAIWMLVMGLKCLRMGFDLMYVRRLCRQQIYLPEQDWLDRLQDLSQRLRIARSIRFVESGLVSIPMTVGFLKPVILMPLGMLAQLPPAHIEAVLLHELAHIRRYDYFVNLLQSVAEILLFFNPALLWLSTLIRTERENCCDDIALSAIENETQYIRALVAFQEFHLAKSPYTLAFAESKMPLLDRIQRIIHHHNTKKLSIMEKISLFVSILLVSTIAFLPLTKTKAQETIATTSFSQVSISGDGTENDPQVIFLRETGGKSYIISRVNKTITDMYVNGKKVEPGQYSDYSAVVKRIDEQLEQDIAQSKLDAEQAARDAEQAIVDSEQARLDSEQAIRDAEQALRDAKQAEADAAVAIQDAATANNDREQALLDAKQAQLDAAQARLDAEQNVRDAYSDREQAKLDAEQAARDAEQATRDAEQAIRDDEQAIRDAEQAHIDSEQAKIDSENDRQMQKNMAEMTNEIVSDQIVSSKKKIKSFALTDTEFIVNGKKQNDVLHKKYKAKYLNQPGYGIYFGSPGQWRGTGYFYSNEK